jgi:hypothetical protein
MHDESHNYFACPIRPRTVASVEMGSSIDCVTDLKIASRRVFSGSLVDNVCISWYDLAEPMVAYSGCA